MNPKYLQEDIKKIYTQLKKIIPNITTESIVAGGAIRDWDNGKDIKDIDIWISTNTTITPIHLDRLFGREQWRIKSKNEEYDVGHINNVVEIQGPHCPVDLIFINTKAPHPRNIIDNFDIDFCKIWYDPYSDLVHRSSSYKTNKEKKVITGIKDKNDHAKRIAKKYPDFKLDLEEEYDLTAPCAPLIGGY